ncbi:GNAT family N-acetyltransferase [Streptomyces sp. A73]|uniref:GNAT family N-acetyltransferase n=1 Tax=Streptomyces sp. RK75 TaxID=2824895 RepID=UPI001B35918D|nr:GNAT family N-acetyltransferase [Streptomyces sp. RK75]MBQ0866834.1 GNAT family N-acetyltransferase [Streptomyces sp. RK75]MBQ1160107.1 GNAT family N-acetyltransferase [Streptomyces sp. A73]
MAGVTWTVRPEPVESPDAIATVRAYIREIAGRYYGRPATEQEVDAALAAEPDDELVPPKGRFLLARAHADGAVAGCAAVLMVRGTTAEIRRVWVAPHSRKGGLGGLLIATAECSALEMGATTVRLDTRDDLVEARRLYARLGYEEIAPFNDSPYADHWFGKTLRPFLGPLGEGAPAQG